MVDPATPRSDETVAEPASRSIDEVKLHREHSDAVTKDILKGERDYSKWGLIAGLIVVGLGVVLLLGGVAGAVDISFSNGATNGRLVTSAVGVVVIIVGAWVINATRYRVDA